MMNKNRPNFKRIYKDLLKLKYPEKTEDCNNILNKEQLTNYDLITLNKIIFGDQRHNQKHKSYDKETITKILDYQIKNRLNNTELSLHFRLSRNTVAKWKKKFCCKVVSH